MTSTVANPAWQKGHRVEAPPSDGGPDIGAIVTWRDRLAPGAIRVARAFRPMSWSPIAWSAEVHEREVSGGGGRRSAGHGVSRRRRRATRFASPRPSRATRTTARTRATTRISTRTPSPQNAPVSHAIATHAVSAEQVVAFASPASTSTAACPGAGSSQSSGVSSASRLRFPARRWPPLFPPAWRAHPGARRARTPTDEDLARAWCLRSRPGRLLNPHAVGHDMIDVVETRRCAHGHKKRVHR